MAYEFARTGELVNFQREIDLHPECIYRPDEHGNTVLFYACSYGHLPIVEHILSLEHITRDIQDLFYTSIVQGHLDIVKKLLYHGASLTVADVTNRTPLHNAVEHQHLELVEEFLRRGAQVNTCAYDKTTPLLTAILQHNVNMVVLLLKHKADVHFRHLIYHNALISSMFIGNIEMMNAVLRTGKFENVKLTCIVKDTILYDPSNLYDVVKTLLEFGCSPNASDGLDTALILACKLNDIPLCELLLAHGANPNQGGYLHSLPIISAVLCPNAMLVHALIARGVNVNSTTAHKESVVNLACAKGSMDIVEPLVSAGAKLTLMTFISALRGKNIHVIQLILQHLPLEVILDNEFTIRTYLLTCSEGIVVMIMDIILDILHCTSIHHVWYALNSCHLIEFPTWHALLPPSVKVEWKQFAQEAIQTEMACYLALYEEQDTMVRFRRGEIVDFSESSLRKLMRPYGARPMRNRVVHYLIHPYDTRLLFR